MSIDKLFKKYDALSMHVTTAEQRRHIHELFEKLGGEVAASTENRDNVIRGDDPWGYHLYIDTEYCKRPQLRGLNISSHYKHKLRFQTYSWWINRLCGEKYFDNTAESSNDTFLDQQLKII